MPFRLTRNARLLKSSDYKAVFNKGVMTHGKYWQVMAKKTRVAPRLGLAITKKAHRLAVDRNRLKRIARESFRVHQSTLQHCDFVVMAKPIKTLPNNTRLSGDLLNVFKRAING